MKEKFLKWLRAATMRAIRTFAQVMLSFMTVGLAFSDYNWPLIISISGASAFASILTSLAGLPEVKED